MSRRIQAILVALAMLAATVGISDVSAGALVLGNQRPTWDKEFSGGKLEAPPTPNPYLANLPEGDDADYRSWSAFAEHSGEGNNDGTRVRNVEERDRNNDSPEDAQEVNLNTNRGNQGSAGVDILGRGPGTQPGSSFDVGPTDELNGSITDAKVLPNLEPGDQARGAGVIGDEVGDPFDFDFFALEGITAGEVITIDIDTPEPFADLDSFVGVWGGGGPFPLLAVNDDGGPEGFDSALTFIAPFDGTFYVSVGGFGAFVPADPFDSSSPSDTGDVGSQGDYTFSIDVGQLDVDFYTFDARQGDVFGATVIGGVQLQLFDPDGSLLIASSQDVTFIHPESSPLPGGGDASLSYVLDRKGEYTLAVVTVSDYEAQLRSFRPLGDTLERGTQIVFLDFDGATIDPGIFGTPPGNAQLSPLDAFLGGWGLDPEDEDAVIDAIVASVEENLKHDIEGMGASEDFAIDIRNSRDDADPWGQPNVSRIIIGGTIPELGIGTIGIAQSIDVGNFDAEETAVVLLDILSANADELAYIPGVSLNDFLIAPGASKIDLIGIGVGNITAHEAGHFFANWHTDQFNPNANIMDQGGNLPGTLGLGTDGIFGSADDVDVDFGNDVFVANEGFIGIEDTLNSIGFGLWSDNADDDRGDNDDDDDDDDEDARNRSR